jgi:hypothetical protein
MPNDTDFFAYFSQDKISDFSSAVSRLNSVIYFDKKNDTIINKSLFFRVVFSKQKYHLGDTIFTTFFFSNPSDYFGYNPNKTQIFIIEKGKIQSGTYGNKTNKPFNKYYQAIAEER